MMVRRLEVSMQDLRSLTFWLLVVVMILTAIVAVGNWQLYGRVANLESNHGLQATPR
jgi:hypothetical protein